jgi:hypothetical protein
VNRGLRQVLHLHLLGVWKPAAERLSERSESNRDLLFSLLALGFSLIAFWLEAICTTRFERARLLQAAPKVAFATASYQGTTSVVPQAVERKSGL